MRIAILPFNAAEGASEPLARQTASLFQDVIRAVEPEGEIGSINYMRPDESEGEVRYILMNPSTSVNEVELLQEIKTQAQPNAILDGLLSGTVEVGTLRTRWFGESIESPEMDFEESWTKGGMIDAFYRSVQKVVGHMGKPFETPAPELFSTASDEAFAGWIVAWDAIQYINNAQGMVARDFSFTPAFEGALRALELDPKLDRAAGMILDLSRMAAQMNVAEKEVVVDALAKLEAARAEDPLTLFNLGSFWTNVGDPNKGSDLLEKAARLEPNEPAIFTALGAAQMQLGMPVNAERNFRKATELQKPEAFDVQPWDLLGSVLAAQNRGHEVPGMWKELLDSQPQNGAASARYAQALLAAGSEQQALAHLDKALESLDDSLPVKRVYAPILAQQGDLDRAMDFYEDYLEEVGTDIPTMLEYTDTLVRADRGFEAEKVLRDVIEASQDPNTKAQAQAWLIEIEQPKRIELVNAATKKAEEGDFAAALKDLKPLRQWLADYWKLWVLLAQLHNQLGEHLPAEEAAKKALELFPACEPAIVELANSLAGQNRAEEAYHMMGNALGAFPNSLGIAIQFGLMAKKAGRTEDARQMAKRIREGVGADEQLEQILREMEG
jgi:tetratricopeptide (TPR) repeat protein